MGQAVLLTLCGTRRRDASVSELWVLRLSGGALKNHLQWASNEPAPKSWMLHWDDSGQQENVRVKCTVEYFFVKGTSSVLNWLLTLFWYSIIFFSQTDLPSPHFLPKGLKTGFLEACEPVTSDLFLWLERGMGEGKPRATPERGDGHLFSLGSPFFVLL